MSGHWRYCVAALLFSAGLSASPAFSNPLTDLLNPAPKEAPAPAPARAEACLPQPGQAAAGQHWFYRLNGHRKCWYEAAAATALVNKRAHHRVARQPVTALERNEAALHKKTVEDARDQLLSTAPADTFQPTPPAPQLADAAASLPASGAATPVPPAPPVPPVAAPAIEQFTPEHATRRHVDVEALLAADAPLSNTAAPSALPAAPGSPAIANAGEDRWQSMATQAGVLLIALGLVCLAGTMLAGRFREPRVMPVRRA